MVKKNSILENEDFSSLQAKNWKQRIISDSLPFSAWVKGIDGRYIDVNKQFAIDAGLSINQIIGKSDYELLPSVQAGVYSESDAFVLTSHKSGYFENCINGRWREEYKTLVYDDAGRIVGTTGFSRDITRRKNMESALKESEKSKTALISNLPGVAYRCRNNKDWDMTYLSDGCVELTGYRPEELLGNDELSYNVLISQKYRDSNYSKWEQDAIENRKSNDEYTIRTKSGEEKWVWEQSVPVQDKDGNLTEREGLILDITETKRILAELDESEDRFRAIFEKAPIGIGIVDTDTGFAHQLNPKFEEILDRKLNDLRAIDWRSYTHPADLQLNLDNLDKLKKNLINSFTMNKRFIKPDGTVVWVNMMIVPYKAKTISNKHLCMIEDITEKKIREEEITFSTFHDRVTGVYNRNFFEEEKRQFELKRKLPLSVVMGDVNGLKLINDSLGHDVGDVLLREIANILKKTCRAEDVIARIGGDEFVILLADTGEDAACHLCQRIHQACEDYETTIKNKSFYLSISLGYATKIDKDQSIDELLRGAERMLYRKKNAERKNARKLIIRAIKNELVSRNLGGAEHYNEQLALATKLGEGLRLSSSKLRELKLLQQIHNIGLLTIDKKIEGKNSTSFNSDELDEYRKHAETGYRIAMAVPEMVGIAEEILYHHELWDGSGYPGGLEGEKIPYLSRIISVLDSYDEVLNQNNSTHESKHIDIKEYFLADAGKSFDPSIVNAFIALI